jgi:putative peptidoglycan binding protein
MNSLLQAIFKALPARIASGLSRSAERSRFRFGSIITFAILAAVLVASVPFPAPVEAQTNCREIVPVSSPPRYAEDYPLPLSLRRNLVFLVQRKMAERREYKGPVDGVYHLQLEDAVRLAQKQLGEEPTGCLTWSLIEHYSGAR